MGVAYTVGFPYGTNLIQVPSQQPSNAEGLGVCETSCNRAARDTESKTLEEICFRGRSGCSMHNSSSQAQAAGGFLLNGGVLLVHPLHPPSKP